MYTLRATCIYVSNLLHAIRVFSKKKIKSTCTHTLKYIPKYTVSEMKAGEGDVAATSIHLYIYFWVCLCVFRVVCVWGGKREKEREREGERERERERVVYTHIHVGGDMCSFIHTYFLVCVCV